MSTTRLKKTLYFLAQRGHGRVELFNWTVLAQRIIKQRFGNSFIEFILLKNKEIL